MSQKQNRIDTGKQIMKEVLGEEQTEGLIENLNAISSSFSNLLQETFGDIYSDKTLDLKTKEIIVLSSLITQKDTKPQLKGHIKAALQAGVSKEEILGVIKQLILYIGFPSTINALLTAKEVFDGIP